MIRRAKLAAAIYALSLSFAFGQQSVPYFPQTMSPNNVVGRLSSGQGPTEQISFTQLLAALFPNGSAAYPFNAASVAFQGSVNGVVTVQAQAAAGTWTLKWPTSQGTANQCLKTTASGSVATTSWANCAFLDANNTWSGTQTFNGNLTVASLANFTGTFQANGTTQTFPASGVVVGTSDSQTLTNKSIDASEVNSGTLGCAREPAMTGDATSSAGTCALAIGANKVTRSMEAQGVARSVIGVAGNATANVADIQGSTSFQFLGVNSAGTGIAFQSLRQILPLTMGAVSLAQATTNFMVTTGNATESNVKALCPIAGTFKNLTLLSSAPAAGQTLTATFRVGGSDTSLTCTITGTGQTCSDSTHTAACGSGQDYSLKVVTSATTGTISFIAGGVEFDSP